MKKMDTAKRKITTALAVAAVMASATVFSPVPAKADPTLAAVLGGVALAGVVLHSGYFSRTTIPIMAITPATGTHTVVTATGTRTVVTATTGTRTVVTATDTRTGRSMVRRWSIPVAQWYTVRPVVIFTSKRGHYQMT